MKLKKLILHGFKSFADKTEFDFYDGITVIVGPNGCGKSNVVDAVKWVLGEQRPSSLRGKEMQDVIFSGTDSRKGQGFAEVSLVLDNEERTLPIDYLEVVVTRRLYRSGESEYLINGNKARLRDVRELLMDSGGGPGALTVMEQGNIDRLLRADPRERRQVFEEAAGIAKYRARRRETERKLERTRENLARMLDMLAEYETRQRSLKIQAGKARRWKEFTEELKKKRIVGALARYHDLSRRQSDVQGQLEEIVTLETAARGDLESAVDAGADDRKVIDRLRDEVSVAEAAVAELVAERRADEERRAARMREAGELVTRADDAGRLGADAARRADTRSQELEQARAATTEADGETRARAAALEEAQARLDEVQKGIAVLRLQRETIDSQRAEAFAAETIARNEQVSCDAEERTIRARLARMDERSSSADRERVEIEARRDERDLSVRRAEEEVRAIEDRLAAADDAIRATREEIDAVAERVARARREGAALQAREEMLQGLVESGEGLTDGSRALLEAAREGVLGTVANLVQDAGEHAAALDQALGDLAGAVIVETTEQARDVIAWLKEGKRGRVRIVPLDRVRRRPMPDRFASITVSSITGKGRDGSGRDALGRDGDVLGGLLAGTRVVATLEEALAQPENGTARCIALTGEEVEASGAIVGGTGDAGRGLVVRNTELTDVAARLEANHADVSQAESSLAAARERMRTWEETVADLKPRLLSARSALRTAAESFATAEKEAAARAEECRLDKAEREEVERMIAECGARRERATKRLATSQQIREELDAEAGASQEQLSGASGEREEAAARQTEARIDVARWTEKLEAVRHRVEALEESIEAARREAEARTEEARICRERRAACLDEIEALERVATEREKKFTELAADVSKRRAAAREVQQRLEAGDRRVRELRDLHDKHREELERHRLRENELRLRVDTLLDQVRRDFGLELAEVEIDEETREADAEQLDTEITDLQRRLERLGNVNHAALDELQEVEEKLEFLRKQETDLVEADKQLCDTIEKIDEVCTKQFTETFEEVRGHFQVTFRKLFGGGKAEIFLENPEDVLGSGIEIRVRPPGKELRNMALLSGGERSLTTVALLFSIYQTKPPPFCLLDEVDAALDESNTVRMCQMIKEFAEKGQFVIITHARPTMTVADTLYGVTMPEAGVSRHVAVRFADIEAGRVVGLN